MEFRDIILEEFQAYKQCFKTQKELCPDEHVRLVTELISVCTRMPEKAYHMNMDQHWHACSEINRKQTMCSAVGCLVADHLNSTLPLAPCLEVALQNTDFNADVLFFQKGGK